MKKEFLQQELIRTIDLTKFADSKSGFLSVYYLGLVGFLISNADTFFKEILLNGYCLLFLFSFILLISLFSGFYFLFKSISPTFDDPNNKKSSFYFSDISSVSMADYVAQMEIMENEEVEKQLLERIYVTSNIVDLKMRSIKNSFISLVISIVMSSFLYLLL